MHNAKSVQIRSFSGPYFPVFGLNTEIYPVNLRIQSKFGKIRTRKTPNLNIFHAAIAPNISIKSREWSGQNPKVQTTHLQLFKDLRAGYILGKRNSK